MPRDVGRPPPEPTISSVVRRLWIEHLAWSLAAGAALAAAAGSYLPALLAVPIAVLATQRYRTRQRAAASIDRQQGGRNLFVTVEELERHPDRASAAMTAIVVARTAAAARGIRGGRVVPVWRTIAAGAVAAAGLVFLSPAARDAARSAATDVGQQLASVMGREPRVGVRVVPPAYSGMPERTLADPDRLEVLEGSRLTFNAGSRRLRFGDAVVTGPFVARASGYFAIDGEAPDTTPTLIPLTVVPDRAPSIRIERPGKDLLLVRPSEAVPLSISSDDDLGLATLELRYTKISGSGEQFEFQEGTLPLAVDRTSPRAWRGTATLPLGAMRLAAGDSIVYRAVARDRRPGDLGLATSDTFMVEIAGPGQVALEGVEMPPELERYAMSQQMIVLKLERLRAREPGLARPAVEGELASLAAEQRTVRANFIFLLGGHVEDEEEEAEQSHEIQEGRLENTARRDINTAIGSMTRAEQAMVAVNSGAALPPARQAVEALQRAFGRSRYLLRSLATRSRLDPSRRLSGDLSTAADWQRRRQEADARAGAAARRLLESIAAAVRQGRGGRRTDLATLAALSESALRIAPATAAWQEIARDLARIGGLPDGEAAGALEQVAQRVARQAAEGLVPLTIPAGERTSQRAWRMEQRR